MSRSIVVRVLALAVLAAALSIQLRGVLFAQPAAAPEIYVRCGNSRSGTDPVGIRFELCTPTAWCDYCLRSEAEDRFEKQLDDLYNCQICLGTGCSKTITQEGFEEEDCEISMLLIDCDPNHPGLEYSYLVDCSDYYYDWEFSCSTCNL